MVHCSTGTPYCKLYGHAYGGSVCAMGSSLLLYSIEQIHLSLYTRTTVIYSLAEVAIDVLGRAKRDSVGRAAIVHAYHDACELHGEVGPVVLRLARDVHQPHGEGVASAEREVVEGMLNVLAVPARSEAVGIGYFCAGTGAQAREQPPHWPPTERGRAPRAQGRSAEQRVGLVERWVAGGAAATARWRTLAMLRCSASSPTAAT